jgi:Na+/H+ antiporter NhaC
MREKFRANIGIALPAALAAVAIYCCIGGSGATADTMPAARALVWHDSVLVLPYVLILVLALMGLNVMMLLFAGTALAAVIGIVCGRFTFWGALDLLGKGTLGMSETLIVAILAGGLLATIRENGGIAWVMKSSARLVRGPRSCEFAVGLLTVAVNLFTANNTVAIVVAGPVAKDFADRCKASPARIASVLDTTSCVTQGLIPYGAQLLMAVGLAKEGGLALGSFHLIGALYYPFFLALSVAAAILFFRPRH